MHKPNDRLRIAWFSPLPGKAVHKNSRAAYFTEQILPIVSSKHDVELFCDDFQSYSEFPTFHYLTAFERHRTKPFDLIFYQLEDPKFCNFIRIHLGLIPGVVLFHDFAFTHFGPEPILNSPWHNVVSLFQSSENNWPERGAEFTQKGPLGYREAAYSIAAIFTDEWSRNEYVRNISHALKVEQDNTNKSFFLPPPVDATNCFRALKGVGKRDFLRVGFAGTPRVEDRSHKLLQAIAKDKDRIELIWLLNSEEEKIASELLEDFNIESAKLISDRIPANWSKLIVDCDLAVHTHFSVFGSVAPYFQMSLTAGLPVLVTDFGQIEYLPNEVVFKIEPGEFEAFQIHEVFCKIMNEPMLQQNTNGAGFAHEMYDKRVIASELESIFYKLRPAISATMKDWADFESKATKSLLEEISTLYPFDGEDAWQKIIEPVFKELGFSS